MSGELVYAHTKSETVPPNALPFNIPSQLTFTTKGLETYSGAIHEPRMQDLMTVAAAVEFGDRSVARSSIKWARSLKFRVPVFELSLWQSPQVVGLLEDVVGFLMGDQVTFEFSDRGTSGLRPGQHAISCQEKSSAVIAYSDGLDSRATAGIMIAENATPDLVKVRLGPNKDPAPNGSTPQFHPVPYEVNLHGDGKESTARSRAFKFSAIAGIAAYLTKAEKIIFPESGQGVFGPALVSSGHNWPDYRNHPLFTSKMTSLLNTVLGISTVIEIPRMFYTKGQTLSEYVQKCPESTWIRTRSCWQKSRWCSVDGKYRQCGMCAACLLRRVSIHAAGLSGLEPEDSYVCNRLDGKTFADCMTHGWDRKNNVFELYAIGAVRHLDDMSTLIDSDDPTISAHAISIAGLLGLSHACAERELRRVFIQHAEEWNCFLQSLPKSSFIRKHAFNGGMP